MVLFCTNRITFPERKLFVNPETEGGIGLNYFPHHNFENRKLFSKVRIGKMDCQLLKPFDDELIDVFRLDAIVDPIICDQISSIYCHIVEPSTDDPKELSEELDELSKIIDSGIDAQDATPFTDTFCDSLMKFLLSHSQEVAMAALHLIGNICAVSNFCVEQFVNNDILPILYSILKEAPIFRSHALYVINDIISFDPTLIDNIQPLVQSLSPVIQVDPRVCVNTVFLLIREYDFEPYLDQIIFILNECVQSSIDPNMFATIFFSVQMLTESDIRFHQRIAMSLFYQHLGHTFRGVNFDSGSSVLIQYTVYFLLKVCALLSPKSVNAICEQFGYHRLAAGLFHKSSDVKATTTALLELIADKRVAGFIESLKEKGPLYKFIKPGSQVTYFDKTQALYLVAKMVNIDPCFMYKPLMKNEFIVIYQDCLESDSSKQIECYLLTVEKLWDVAKSLKGECEPILERLYSSNFFEGLLKFKNSDDSSIRSVAEHFMKYSSCFHDFVEGVVE